MTTEKSPDQHHGIFTVRDPTTEKTLNIQDYHKEIQEILQIQDRHIKTHHCLIETTDMNRIGPDIKKQGLTKGITDNVHQITIISQLLYNELTRANRDKANDAMFAAIKT